LAEPLVGDVCSVIDGAVNVRNRRCKFATKNQQAFVGAFAFGQKRCRPQQRRCGERA
jgi:hypothetical protein